MRQAATTRHTRANVDFSFTDEQNQLRRSIREFAEGEIAPHVMEWDEASKFPRSEERRVGKECSS